MSTSTPRPTTSVSTAELYNRWSTIYDTDGNILQALDDVFLPPLLLSSLTHLSSTTPSPSPLTTTELGAGTGRNTAKLLDPSLPVRIGRIIALDLSEGMLDVAKGRCGQFTESLQNQTAAIPTVEFHAFDALNPSETALKNVAGKADLVLSTLVLEHLPIKTFFQTVRTLLKPTGGFLVLTNMHAEMGRVSQAGFWDEERGVKVRGESFVYEVGDVVEVGEREGFQLVGGVEERGVEEEDIGEGRILGKRGRKWVGVKCWFGCVMRFIGEGKGDGEACEGKIIPREEEGTTRLL